MQIKELKSLFLKTLIGCLIAVAALAVVAVLLGGFTDVVGKALATIVLIGTHAALSLAFIINNEKQETFENLAFFTNATFTIIVLSFMTSILGVWGLMPGELVWELYVLYFVLLFATLHGEVLAKTTGKQSTINRIVYTNYLFMAGVILMLVPVIFINDSGAVLGEFYFRLLAAIGIVDATLTLVAIILHKLYLQKHPKTTDAVFNMPQSGSIGQTAMQGAQSAAPQKKGGMNIFVAILIALVALQIVGALIVGVIGGLTSRGSY